MALGVPQHTRPPFWSVCSRKAPHVGAPTGGVSGGDGEGGRVYASVQDWRNTSEPGTGPARTLVSHGSGAPLAVAAQRIEKPTTGVVASTRGSMWSKRGGTPRNVAAAEPERSQGTPSMLMLVPPETGSMEAVSPAPASSCSAAKFNEAARAEAMTEAAVHASSIKACTRAYAFSTMAGRGRPADGDVHQQLL